MENAPTNRSLRYFILLMIGHNIALFGNIITQFNIFFYTIEITGGIRYLTLLNLAIMLPSVLVMLFGSVFSDLLNRRMFLITLSILKAISTIIFILLFRFGVMRYGMILLFTCLTSILQAFYLPTFYSIIPTMIPQKQLSRINGLAYLITTIVQFLVSFWMGYLLTFLEIYQILWIEVISIGLAIIPLIFIKIPDIRPKLVKSIVNKRKSSLVQYFRHFINGFKAIRLVPGLVILFISIMMLTLLIQPMDLFFPFYVHEIHSGNFLILGVLFWLNTIGIVIGVIITLIKKYWNPTVLMFFISAFIPITGYLILAFAPYRSFLLLGINNIIMSAFLVIPQTIFLSTFQTNIPKEKIGRVYGIYLAISSFIPFLWRYLSGPFLSVFGTYIGIRFGFLINSIVGMLAFILIFSLSGIKTIKYKNFIAQEDYFQIEKKELN